MTSFCHDRRFGSVQSDLCDWFEHVSTRCCRRRRHSRRCSVVVHVLQTMLSSSLGAPDDVAVVVTGAPDDVAVVADAPDDVAVGSSRVPTTCRSGQPHNVSDSSAAAIGAHTTFCSADMLQTMLSPSLTLHTMLPSPFTLQTMLPSPEPVLHTMLPSPFTLQTMLLSRCRRSRRCCRRRRRSRRCCRRRRHSRRCCRRSSTLQTMLSSSWLRPTRRAAPVCVLSGAPRLVGRPCVAAGQRHAAGDQVVAPDDVTGPADALVRRSCRACSRCRFAARRRTWRGALRPSRSGSPRPASSSVLAWRDLAR